MLYLNQGQKITRESQEIPNMKDEWERSNPIHGKYVGSREDYLRIPRTNSIYWAPGGTHVDGRWLFS